MSQIIVCLRYDDWGAYEEAMQYDMKLIDIADKYNCPITLSVVPQGKNLKKHKRELFSKKFYNALREEKIEIALHGYKHKRGILEKLLHVYGEFGKKPLFIQKRQLKRGTYNLAEQLGQKVKVFVPPFNTYDKNTVKILAEEGFELISDGPSANRMFGRDATSGKIKRLPFTCGIESILDLVEKIDKAESSATYCIVALFHYYNYSIDKVEELVSQLSEKNNVCFSSLKNIQKSIGLKNISEMESTKEKYYRI